MNALHKSSCSSLEQILAILTAVHQKQIDHSQEIYISAGVGRHIRHIIDHYSALKNGLDSGVVDYNQRTRNSVIETNLFSAKEKIQKISDWLNNQEDCNKDVIVNSEIDCEQSINQKFSSNKDRELLYLINHTIHHAAYIKLQLQKFEVYLPEQIGVAPCTASHLRQETLVY